MAHALNRFVARLEVGDVVRFPRGRESSHVALYAGDAKVIHHWSPSSSERAKVRVDPIRRVQAATTALPEFYTTELDEEILDDRGLMPFDGHEVVERAKRKLGDRTCTDCVDFVTWARYGSAIFTVHEQTQSDTRASNGLVVGGILAMLKGNESESEEEDDHRRRHPPSRTFREDANHSHNNLNARREERPCHSHDIDNHACVVSSHTHEFVNHRHDVLITRLAEDELQCGICFIDLLDVRTMAFLCDHFTCGECYSKLPENDDGHKCCPFCRLEFRTVDEIHESIKARANDMLQQQTSRAFN
uniref:RING-type domain-containing protein n=1 Tax=Globisporangium ultimum (strain ATCC 200006 / CBS 805.95 / DAOM BR144) TaxID=431595 RepID=K3WED5_GLOUD